jgi:hypothetical protein
VRAERRARGAYATDLVLEPANGVHHANRIRGLICHRGARIEAHRLAIIRQPRVVLVASGAWAEFFTELYVGPYRLRVGRQHVVPPASTEGTVGVEDGSEWFLCVSSMKAA